MCRNKFYPVVAVLLTAVIVQLLLPDPIQAQGDATSTGVSRDFNPAISLNSLFLGSGFLGRDNRDRPWDSGLRFQETEIQFTADVDPYSSATLIFTFEEDVFDLEEGYVLGNFLPGGLGLRAGKMFLEVGRENTLHSHQLPFVDKSLFASAVLGEALAEFGVEVSYVPPTNVFMELRAGVFNGDNPTLFAGPNDWDLAYLTGGTAMIEVSDSSTMSVRADYTAGPNSLGTTGSASWSQFFATTLRFKWSSPTPTNYWSVDIVSEYVLADRNDATGLNSYTDRGFYSYASMQVSRRWHVQGRYDRYEPDSSVPDTQRGSLLFAFVPSEFSAIRFQSSLVSTPSDRYAELTLQYNFTIGSHPAHSY